MEHAQTSPETAPPLTEENLDQLVDALRSDPQALAAFVERASPNNGRTDGWTPFARRLFLEVLAETGRVSRACEYAQLTPQSAYRLRARDPLFAASWDAACELARAPLADALYERALDGVTETITKDGEVVATRHRHDNRLSIAVLNRLDKRCDRAIETGANHLPILRHWDEWITLVGRGEDAAAEALLDSSEHHQLHQLPLGENPTAEPEEVEEVDPSDRCWSLDELGDKVWKTDFPPPPGFTGWQKGDFGDWNYERDCTDEEAAVLEAKEAAEDAAERKDDERLRDAWFAMLKEESQSPASDPAATSGPGDETPAGAVLLPGDIALHQLVCELGPDLVGAVDAHADQTSAAGRDVADRGDADFGFLAMGDDGLLAHIEEDCAAHADIPPEPA